MRMPRIKESCAAYYHVISRVIDRRMLLTDEEKERFRLLMRKMEGFSGVDVLDYTILDNHFHLVLFVPQARELSEDEIVERLGCLYKENEVGAIVSEIKRLRESGDEAGAEAERQRYLCRMHDLSEYCKTVKQRFTQSYNRRHDRKGTLWEERFKSLIVEGRGHALATVAAYVDLNALRAGLVGDPKDYRFSGYGEAMGGSARARAGITKLMAGMGITGRWREVAAAYRRYLYEAGGESGLAEAGGALKPGIPTDAVEQVRAEGGELSRAELLRCRVRYFSEGVILGSRLFVDDVFARYRDRFSARRKSGARPMLETAWEGLCTARRLRLGVISPPV